MKLVKSGPRSTKLGGCPLILQVVVLQGQRSGETCDWRNGILLGAPCRWKICSSKSAPGGAELDESWLARRDRSGRSSISTPSRRRQDLEHTSRRSHLEATLVALAKSVLLPTLPGDPSVAATARRRMRQPPLTCKTDMSLPYGSALCFCHAAAMSLL